MNNYENEILGLLPGNTPKEKYEGLIKLQHEYSYALGRLAFVNLEFDNITDWIDGVKEALRMPLSPFPSLCECGSQKRDDSKYCDGCNKFHSI